MTFSPIIPMSGLAGWRFLESTSEAQKKTFNASSQLKRETDHFREKIGKVTSAAELVADRTLFKVALGAFGLDEEIDKKFFMQKVLAEGSENRDAIANRLVDTRYREFAKAFGFGNESGPRNDLPGFANRLIEEFGKRQFERAVGNADGEMRLAMTFRREISALANSTAADSTAWFQVMGNPPLRRFFEQAFNLPRSVGSLDIDRQRNIFREKARSILGSSSLSALKDPEKIEKMTRLFFARSISAQQAGVTTPGFAAVAILNAGSNSLANLIRSNQ